MNNKERKQLQRQRKREAGYVPLEVWVKKEHKERLKEVVKELNNINHKP